MECAIPKSLSLSLQQSDTYQGNQLRILTWKLQGGHQAYRFFGEERRKYDLNGGGQEDVELIFLFLKENYISIETAAVMQHHSQPERESATGAEPVSKSPEYRDHPAQ